MHHPLPSIYDMKIHYTSLTVLTDLLGRQLDRCSSITIPEARINYHVFLVVNFNGSIRVHDFMVMSLHGSLS